MTLVELAVSITVLAFALCAAASTVITTGALNQKNHETEVARRAAENMIEVLRNTDFARVFPSYNSSPADDPGGAGTAPGNLFAVTGLTPLPGAPGGVAGQIFFPSAGPALVETVTEPSRGMPRDLNSDGVIDAANHVGDNRVLPVRVRIQWKSKNGPRTVELSTLLSEL
jgi:type II secretory pathway pseudopilin PulG